jgi:lipopolysaccharide transport system ATP-binding protein
MQGAITVRGLGKRFARRRSQAPRTLKQLVLHGFAAPASSDHFWAVRDVSFDVSAGEMLGVLGHNGSGKSTLLRMLGGVMPPDTGSVEVRGRVNGLLDLNAGMQPDLSGRENIFINGVVSGLTRRDVRSRLDDIVAFAELEPFIDNPVRTYSSGMKMRLGFAVAAHADPEVLLIDEVLSVGDAAFQKKCLARIKDFKNRGSAVVLITHDLEQLEELCDRALWLKQGQIVAQGEPAVLAGEYKAAMMNETNRRMPAETAERLTADGRALRLNENRYGSLDAEIEDVRLLDAAGRPVDCIAAGDSLTIEISVDAKSGVESPRFGVSISFQDREGCLDVNTDDDRVAIDSLSGVHKISLHLSRMDLAAGEYEVSVGVYERDWAFAYDFHWRAYRLRVTDDRLNSGLLAPPRRWAIN